MKTLEKTFLLIKSLSDFEKKQFKKQFKNVKDESVFKDLFEKLDVNVELNENKISVDENDKIIRQFYDFLLEFLEKYRACDPIEERVDKVIAQAKVLFERGLYDESFNILNDAYNTANKYEMYLKIAEICDLELLLIPKIYTKDLQHNYDLSVSKKKDALEKDISQTNYYKLGYQISNFYTQNLTLKNEQYIKEIDALMHVDILKNKDFATTFYSRFYYYVCHQLYAILKGKDSSQIKEEHIQHWESHPFMIEKNQAQYFNILSTYMYSCLDKNEYETYLSCLQKASKINMYSESDKINFIFRFYKNKYIFLLKQGNVTRLIQESEDAVKKLNLVYKYPYNYARIYTGMEFSLCLAYFLAGENKKVRKYISKIINNVQGKNEQFQFLIYSLRLLQLMVAYEAKDFTFLADLIKTNRQYLERHDALSHLTVIFINYLKKILAAYEEKEKINYFIDLKKELNEKAKPVDIFSVFGFDVITWLDSKIENKSMEEIIKNKAMLEYPQILTIELPV